MMSFSIHSIKSFNDNYIWALVNFDSKVLWIVDPGDSAPVIEFIEKNNLKLIGALITHHHYDHCDGLDILSKKYDIIIYGPAHASIKATHIVKDEEMINLFGLDLIFKVLGIPGHTLEHVAYYCASDNFIFCGDTLFSAGCGRVFEGTFEQMHDSLSKLSSLPNYTKIYCAHEYTLSNLKFAKYVEPDNQDIDEYVLYVKECIESSKPSLPSNIFIEKKVNPFLRTEEVSIINNLKANLNIDLIDSVHVFSELRILKDSFK